MFDAAALKRKYMTKLRHKRTEIEALNIERATLEARIIEIDGQISQLQIHITAWDELINDLTPSGGSNIKPTPTVLRPGTILGKIYELLKVEGQPLHIHEILNRIGKEVNRKNRASITGTLGAYVRDGNVFTRPAPNTFGLLEWSGGEPPTRNPQPGDSDYKLPDGFGDI